MCAAPEELGDYRVGGFAGAFVPNTQSWSGSGMLNGIPISASGKLTLNTGWAAGGLLGYSFEKTPGLEWLNIDLELGYVSSTFNRFDGNIAIAGLGNFAGPAPLDGDIRTIAGFLNVLATPFGIRQVWNNRLTPFIGFGPGVANSRAKIRSLSVGPVSLPINSISTETDFAFDVAVGTDIAILPETAPQLELGISYEYTWIDVKHLGTGAGIQANAGAASGHIFGMLLEYRFGGATR
jgi:opacity protein-like surface antigen